jgi:hypothetical protein
MAWSEPFLLDFLGPRRVENARQARVVLQGDEEVRRVRPNANRVASGDIRNVLAVDEERRPAGAAVRRVRNLVLMLLDAHAGLGSKIERK